MTLGRDYILTYFYELTTNKIIATQGSVAVMKNANIWGKDRFQGRLFLNGDELFRIKNNHWFL